MAQRRDTDRAPTQTQQNWKEKEEKKKGAVSMRCWDFLTGAFECIKEKKQIISG